MYQLTTAPFTYPVTRKEADASLFKEHGRAKSKGPLSADDMALVSLTLTENTPSPDTTSEQVATRDAAPTIVDGASVFGWSVRAKTSDEFDAAKATKLTELAEIRWNAEASGTTFNGNPLATDRTTQDKLTGGFAKAVNDPDYVITSWKFAPGVFGSLDATAIIAAANTVAAHVQACFSNEEALSGDVLAAMDFAALEAVDLTVSWP
jgi:hypothetical protein